MSVAENEIVNLKDFFKKSCRPGPWVADEAFNEHLSKDLLRVIFGSAFSQTFSMIHFY